MSSISDNPAWPGAITQIETIDSVLGGTEGKINAVTKELGDRTDILREAVDAVTLTADGAKEAADQALQKIDGITETAGGVEENARLALERMEGAQAAQALAEEANRTANLAAGQTADNLRLSNEAAIRAGQKAAQADAAALASVQGAAISTEAKNYILSVEDEIREAADAVNESIAEAAASAVTAGQEADRAKDEADRAAGVVADVEAELGQITDNQKRTPMVYATLAEAEAAAATLPDGQEVFLKPYVYTVRNGSLSEQRKYLDIIIATDYGLSISSTRAQNSAALASVSAIYDSVFVPQGVFQIDREALPYLEKTSGDGFFDVGGVLIPAGDIKAPLYVDVGITGAHFERYSDAINYLMKRRLSANVTLNLTDSEYQFTTNACPIHPDGVYIRIIGRGKTLTKLKFDFTGKQGLMEAAFKVVGKYVLGFLDKVTIDGMEMSGRTGIAGTDFGSTEDPVGILAREGATVNLGNDVAIVGMARNAVIAFLDSYIYCNGIEVVGVGGDAIVSSTGSLVRANGATVVDSYGYGFNSGDYATLAADNSSVVGMKAISATVDTVNNGSGYVATRGGLLKASGTSSKKNHKHGYLCADFGKLIMDGALSGGSNVDKNGGNGIRVYSLGEVVGANVSSTHNTSQNLLAYGGARFSLPNLNTSNGLNDGVEISQGATGVAVNLVSSNNTGMGVDADSWATLVCDGITADGNGLDGVNANSAFVIGPSVTSIKNNTGRGIETRYSGVAEFHSASLATAVTGNGTGATSPAADTSTGAAVSKVYAAS